jgi:hypothetical protein
MGLGEWSLIFLFATSSELALGSTQPTKGYWGGGGGSPSWSKLRRSGIKLTASLYEVPRLRMCGDIPPFTVHHMA